MSLIKQKSLVFEEKQIITQPTTNTVNAIYDITTNTIILNCHDGTIFYLHSDITNLIHSSFNVKIINVYKNISKPIKLIYSKINHFGNRVVVIDKNNNYFYGSSTEYKFPLFFNGVPHLNNHNNKYIEQSFYFESLNNENLVITKILTAF